LYANQVLSTLRRTNRFQVTFNVSCRIGDEKEKGYLRECQDCGGRFITLQKDERMEGVKDQSTSD